MPATDLTDDGAPPPAHQRVARLQMALARLGLFALESVDVPALIDESLREIVRQLDVDYGFVFRMRAADAGADEEGADEEGAGDALVVGSAGLSGTTDREVALPAGEGTLAGHMLTARAPAVIEDWGAEERFARPAFFAEQGIASSVAVRITGRGKTYGVLCACTAEPRAFGEEETQFLRTTATIVGRAVELRQAERDRLTADFGGDVEGHGGRERFRTLAEAIPQQVWSATPEGELNFVNKQVLEYMRSSSADVLDAGWFALMHPEDREEAEAAWHTALETSTAFEQEVRLRSVGENSSEDGSGESDSGEGDSSASYRWFLCRAVPMEGRDGETVQWYGTNTDITRQKEDAVEQRRLAAVVENASDFVGSFTLDGDLHFLNEAGCAMVGLAGQEAARQKSLADFHEDKIAYLNGRILPAVRSEGRWQGEFSLQNFETGEATPIDADFFLTRDPTTHEQEYIVTVYRDISPYKEAREQAQQANKAKSQFLANMSHELRTPLNAVIGYSEMIREDAKDRAQAEGEPVSEQDREVQEQLIADLEQIHTAGEQLLSMVNDVLDISKIEAGEMKLHASRFDVRAMVEETGDTIRPLVEEKGNEFELDCPEDIGTMYTDRTKLRQGLFNLLGNAAKFTKDGRVTLRVRREEIEQEDGSTEKGSTEDGLSFAVEDTGVGMKEEDKQEVFEAFQQADTSLTREHEGTGLGLVITRNFSRLMGGDVTVESEEGVGSTFTMYLPATLEGVPEAQDTQEEEEGASLEEKTGEAPDEETAPDAKGPVPAAEADFDEDEATVLVIDDDQRARDLIGRHLKREGFAVAAAASGDEGLEAARRLRPTVITLDVMMPQKDGWDILSALQSDELLADIPVVMVTIVDDEEMGYMLGAADYLTKPLDAERLVGVLRKYRTGGAGQTVMVIEDDEPTRALMRRTLEKEEGCTIYEAENGRQALDELDEAQPDLILLDLMMPEMDGFTFLDRKQEREAHRAVPVVVVTAKELTEDDRRRLNEHAASILQKGNYDRSDLLSAVSDRVKTMAGT